MTEEEVKIEIVYILQHPTDNKETDDRNLDFWYSELKRKRTNKY